MADWIFVGSIIFLIVSWIREACLRNFVRDLANWRPQMRCFVLKVVKKGLKNSAYREVHLPLVCQKRLWPAGFIVLRSTGGQSFTSEIRLPRARDA